MTDEEYAHIGKSALAHDEDVNTWCRKLVVIETRDGYGLTKTEQLLYKEIARVRYLIDHGFRMMFSSKEPTAPAWKKYTADIDQHSETIAADQDHGLVFTTKFGNPIDIPTLTKQWFKLALVKAELPPFRLYDLRHTHATLLLSNGENPKVASERLGHSTTVLTLDTYSHVLPDMQEEAARRIENVLFGQNRA
ncbi:MAG: tyrosine-type recombinase/integrase [Pyrinomonadaceae bacterium]